MSRDSRIYMANPDLKKWEHFELYPAEVALYCSSPHFQGFGGSLFTAVTFEGATIKIKEPPHWALKTNNSPPFNNM
jgi:hypothetical protein